MNSVMSFEIGTVFLEAGALTPASLLLRYDSFLSGWDVVEAPLSGLEKQMSSEGWSYFFLAGEMKSTSYGLDAEKSLAAALKQLASMTRALRCNSFEISKVGHKLFLGVSRVTVSCHARHLQKGHLLFSE